MQSKIMIPDASKKPDWANYWAQDNQGRFWWTEIEPTPGNNNTPMLIEQVKYEDMMYVTIYPLETGAKA